MPCSSCGSTTSDIKYKLVQSDGTTTIHDTRAEAEAEREAGGKISPVRVSS